MTVPSARARLDVRAGPLDPGSVEAVLDVAARAERLDGVAALSEASRLALAGETVAETVHVLAWPVPGPGGGSELAGYAQRPNGTDAGELVVDPSARLRGIGGLLLDGLLDMGTAGVWAHGDLPGAQHLATQRGMSVARALLQLTRSLGSPLPGADMPPGIRLATYQGPQDVAELLRVNSAAFVDLPDQSGWTGRDVAARVATDWFDPAGLLLAWDGDALAGFHWTKAQSDELGEVYVIGVDPAQQGRGLGQALLAAGLNHLREAGHTRVMLYVDESNVTALRVYQRTGFEVARRDVVYAPPRSAGIGSAAGASTVIQPGSSGRLDS